MQPKPLHRSADFAGIVINSIALIAKWPYYILILAASQFFKSVSAHYKIITKHAVIPAGKPLNCMLLLCHS
jgi:hypothetical protein